MPADWTYEYAIVRLVPRVEREEFINLGVLLYVKRRRYLEVRYFIDSDRIDAFAPGVDVLELTDYLRAWEAICAGTPRGGRIGALDQHLRFRWLAAARSTTVQCSPTHPGRCTDPAATLEWLMDRYVR